MDKVLVNDRLPFECKAYTVMLLLLWSAFNLVYELYSCFPLEELGVANEALLLLLLLFVDERLLNPNPLLLFNKLIFGGELVLVLVV